MTSLIKPQMLAPDSVTPIVAYRYWQVSADGYLVSLNGVRESNIWPGRKKMTAICPGKHVRQGNKSVNVGHIHDAADTPHRDCTCGVHAYNMNVIGQFGLMLWCLESAIPAVGLVNLWGKVISDDEAHKAAHAYPISIILITRYSNPNKQPPLIGKTKPPRWRTPAMLLRKRYGVPVASMTGSEVCGWMDAGGPAFE